MKFDKSKIEQAIAKAEEQTSGEISVHLTSFTGQDVLGSAKNTFEKLGLTATRERNAILFYIAKRSHKFAILGDTGIHEKVQQEFWDAIRDKMVSHFKKEKFTECLVEAILLCGEKLKAYFPVTEDNPNELSNVVSED
ncbi:MAG: TPM domain-containing protein [Deltaproteobacteria bacterium]|nr:TPM domain-containing protein [Deltaproteobacteria bacterium]